MSNPQGNPGTPPQPTPSDSSTPPPPSTTPQPRRRRVKMLARKTVATDDSFKSASEGEGTGSSDSEKAQNSPSEVHSALAENLENRFVLVGSVRNVELPELGRRGESGKKSGGSGSGEAVEGLVNLCSQADEPGSSVEETIPDLLKKVGASYDPKKRRTPTPNAPSTTKLSKKRKASSPTTAEIPLPKGRATRSMVKQSESELQKALAEVKKKRMDKGKAKVAEPSEAVDIEEMEQVHQEEHTAVERTRSTMKNKQVRITEDEEWSGEKRMDGRLARNEIIEFMENAEVKDGRVTGQVKGVQLKYVCLITDD
ncbi:PREDICTED: uncharacterized protein LOC109237476 [Nicotiana attenuata]|uniref:uncharacterized protein LOC109237476 n=1 Tax=Nicotiana attenuata TaxID=49451 RepID=UPI0009056D2B|nr:PREDICTED: uncharacterized protein LOC109237476 [Nicotiana attenuata]